MADGTPPPQSADKQLGEIVGDVTSKASLLVREEIELAKAEVSQKVKRLGIGAGLITVAAVFMFFFLIFLLHMLALGLADWFSLKTWVGYAIVCVSAGASAYFSTSSRSARNHRSRSSHGTAAFAGEVEGRTKSRVSPRHRSCGPSSGRSLKAPRYASLPTNASHAGRRSRAMCSRRCAEPSKSPRRRSPEPFVVRYAAFVRPMPNASASCCSRGSSTRGVNPAAWSSRQKSLRGLAK